MPATQADVTRMQEIVMRVFRSFRSSLLEVTGAIDYTRKSDESQVTAWDLRIEETLRTALYEYDSSIGFRGEETGLTGSEDALWIVDPIDGTSSFIRGIDYATNMAAYVENGDIKAAVIYDFYRDDMYTAIKGEGAYKNDTRLHVNNSRLEGDLFLYAFYSRTLPQIREALNELGMRALLPIGASGRAYVLLASGKIDGIVSIGSRTKVHDIAPGLLLATEAGAEVLRYDGEDEGIPTEVIVGSPHVIDSIERSGLL